MKWWKRMIGLLLVGIFAFGLTACQEEGQWKDRMIGGFDSWLQSVSQYSLTQDGDLQGKRFQGKDSYTGTYEVEYQGFSGKECLFGGTFVQKEEGRQIKITYHLEIRKGTGTLYWIEKGEKHIIFDSPQDGVYDLTLSAGDNYIVMEGDGLDATLKIEIE